MRKSNKGQPKRSRKETEKLLLEMTAKVEALVKVTERYSFEKDIDELKLIIDELRRKLLEALAKLKRFAEDWRVEKQLLEAVDKLKQDEEEQVNRLLKSLNDIKYFSEKTETDKDLRSQELEKIQKEAIAITTNITERADIITDDIIRYIIEDEQYIFEEASREVKQRVEEHGKQFMSMLSQLHLLAEAVNAGKQLTSKIDELKDYIEKTERDLLSESIELKLVPGKPGADKEYKLAELSRVWDKEVTFYEEVSSRSKSIVDEIDPFIKAKQTRQKTLSIVSSLFVLILNVGNYILLSHLLGLIPIEMTALLTWLITGFLLVIVSTIMNILSSNLIAKYTFRVKWQFLKLTTILLLMSFSSLFIDVGVYIIAQHYLFLSIFPIVTFISNNNPIIAFLGTISAIITIISVFFSSFVKKQVRKILLFLP